MAARQGGIGFGDAAPATAIERLKHSTFFGREKENLVFPIAQARADAIDAAVFDLKAVNPNARGGQDDRSPEAILAAIAEHQRTIDAALSRLNRLLKEPDSGPDHGSPSS